jgi:hypothetical protein
MTMATQPNRSLAADIIAAFILFLIALLVPLLAVCVEVGS